MVLGFEGIEQIVQIFQQKPFSMSPSICTWSRSKIVIIFSIILWHPLLVTIQYRIVTLIAWREFDSFELAFPVFLGKKDDCCKLGSQSLRCKCGDQFFSELLDMDTVG